VFLIFQAFGYVTQTEPRHGGDESGGGCHGGAARGRNAAEVRPAGQGGAVPEERGPQEGLRGSPAEGEVLTTSQCLGVEGDISRH